MAKPYGKTPIRTRKRKAASAGGGSADAFKLRLRGKDDTPLSMPEMQQALYQAAKELVALGPYRAKRATIYVNLVDEDGSPVTVGAKNEISIYPYRSAADEHGA